MKNLLLIFFLYVVSVNGDLPNVLVSSRYPNSKAFDSTLTAYWKLSDDQTEIEICLVGQVDGWVGIGFSRGSGMLNSDPYIGWVDSNGVATVVDHNIGDERSTPDLCSPSSQPDGGVCPDTIKGGVDNVLAYNGSATSGMTTIVFTRKLNTGDAIDVVITNKLMTVIYGWNTDSDGPSFDQHTVIPTPVNINFFTGQVSSNIDTKLVHGSLMFIAWFFIAPTGFIFARFLKGYNWWFNAHKISMSLGMIIMICGFGVIVSEVQNVKSGHFNNAHKIIGLIIVIIGVSQPIIGFLADKFFNPERKSIPIFPDKTHWVLGWVSITLGLINIILGLILYPKTSHGTLVAYCVFAGVLFATLVGFSVFRLIKPPQTSHK